ncbi:MAG: CCA tRNA nucleotidyltransferase [Pleurocapsa sp.]
MTLKKLDSYLAQVDLPVDLNCLPRDAYLVGGSVRDALLKRYKNHIDLDFVLPQNAIATAKEIAHRYGGGFVVLDEVRGIARVVFPQGTLDLALQEGDSLEKDLHRRDFTINAIAYNLKDQKIVDPFEGLADLERGLLRTISRENLQDDPLRLLRAYRQAAQLNFTIEPQTREFIRSLAPLLTQIAAERVQTELSYILHNSSGNKWLKAAWKDGLITPWLPSIDGEKIQQLTAIEQAVVQIDSQNIKLKEEWLYLAKLSALVASEPAKAERELNNLKYSRSQIRAVVATVKHLSQLQTITETMSLREQYFFFLDIKDVFPVLMIRAIATGVNSTVINPLIKRYFSPQDKIAHPQPLVTGKDLIEELKIKPSPIVGNLLTEIQIAYIEDKISNFQEAIEFAVSLLENK